MKRSLLVALLLACVAAPIAQAQYQSPQQVKYAGAGPWGFSKTGYGVKIGPYALQLLGEPGQPTIDVFCVDFENYVYTGSSGWTATINNVGSGDLTQTRQGAQYSDASVVQTRYRAAAWLAGQMNPGNGADWWKYHGAIWLIMSGPTLGAEDRFYNPFWNSSVDKNAVLGLANTALTSGYRTVSGTNWAVITPTGARNSQEFLTQVPTVVPEPATLLLLGSGLLALVLVGYMRGHRA